MYLRFPGGNSGLGVYSVCVCVSGSVRERESASEQACE